MPTFCKCDSLNSSFCKGGLVVFIHPQAHLIVNELLLMTFQTLLFCFCIFFFVSLMFWTAECNLMLYIGVIMEDGFIFGYLILYLIFSLSFVKCAVWEYMALDVWKIQYVSKWLFCWGVDNGWVGGGGLWTSTLDRFLCSLTVYAQELALG